MDLKSQLPQEGHILGIAERILKKYPDCKGKCEFIARDLTNALNKAGFRADHVMGNFHLDYPGAFDYISPEDEEYADDYVVSHDWVNVEGKVLDIAATQFQQYVEDKIPEVVFIGYAEPLHNHYEELGHV